MTAKSAVNEGSDGKVQLRRVQLDLPPRAFERLTKLKLETEAATYAEVIRNALKLYDSVIEMHQSGNELMLKQRDGSISPLPILKP